MDDHACCRLTSAIQSVHCFFHSIGTEGVVAWSTVILAVTSLITIFILMAQTRTARLQSRIVILMNYTDRFDLKRMKDARRIACIALKNKRSQADTDVDMSDADDVLDFFEELALLVRKKAIEPVYVWHSFYYWIHRYFVLCEDYITSVRKDPKERSSWEDLVWLHSCLVKYEMKRNKCTPDELKVSEGKLDDFIEEEIGNDIST